MTIRDRLQLAGQYLLPAGLLTRLMYWLTRRRRPVWLRVSMIRAFIRAFRVDMSEAADSDPSAYEHFNAFFTRALKAGSRPLPADPKLLLSPVDGAVSELGCVEQGRMLQAKGRYYEVAELLGSRGEADRFQGGSFATLYLAPRDYHRIHMPCAGTLRQMVYVPGALFSVSPATVSAIPKLFARNERVVCSFDTEWGALALVLVGAVNVAAIETVWAGLVTPPRGRGQRRVEYPRSGPGSVSLARGAEMGRFNMGSTVVLVTTRSDVTWRAELGPQVQVRMGIPLGRVETANDREVDVQVASGP